MALTSLKSNSGIKDKSKSSKCRVEKRLTFHAKRKNKNRQRKLRAYDLSALSEFLPDLDVSQQPAIATNLKLSCKSRQKLAQRESAQLNAVLNNPVFQMDPITAIQHHLESTQPPAVVIKDEGKRPNRPGSEKRKAKSTKKGAQSIYGNIINVL